MKLRILYIFCLLFFLPHVSLYAFDGVEGEPPQHITWSKEEGPYTIPQDMVIDQNTTLTIEAGTELFIEDTTHISVYGSLIIVGTTTDQVILDSSYIESANLTIHVFGGILDITGLRAVREVSVYGSQGARIALNYSYFETINEIQLFKQSNLAMRYSTVDSIGSVLVREEGTMLLEHSLFNALTGDTFTFNIFGTSTLSVTNSTITPVFSSFVLLLDNSTLYATSTRITNTTNHAIEAIRNSRVYLDDVFIDGVTSTDNQTPSFLTLIGSSGFVSRSRFSSSSGNGIELFKTGNIPYSTLYISHSTIENCSNTGIYAVFATGTIFSTLIQDNQYGVEYMFSNISISNSTIRNNTDYGVIAYVSDYPMRASDNFWGDASGPHHSEDNPLGMGEELSDSVFFHPWLTSDPMIPCCSSVFFIPGFEASRLYRSDNQLWEPTSLNPFTDELGQLFFNSNGTSVYTDVYTKDVIGEGVVRLLGPNIYKSFLADMNSLQDSHVIQDFRVFPYDWRFSINDVVSASSSYMIHELVQTAHTSKTGKVTIVAHSNGGLIAKYLLRLLQNENLIDLVDSVIFVAVPQYGTPSAVGALLHGFNQGIGPFVSAGHMREFGENLPGAYGLLPSGAYFNLVTDPVIEFAATSTFFGKTISSISTLTDFLLGKEGRKMPLLTELSSAFILHKEILSQAHDVHTFIDSWLPPESVRVLQIAGWGIDTVKGIRYYTKSYKPLLVKDGDGTVVVPSALVLPTSTPRISRYWVDLEAYNKGLTRNRSHADILETTPVRELIKHSIAGMSLGDIPYVSTSTPTAAGTENRLRFFLYADNASFDIYDSAGNHTGIASTTGFVEENVPGTYYREFGNVIYVSFVRDMPPETHPTSEHSSYRSSIVIGLKRGGGSESSRSPMGAVLEIEDISKVDNQSLFYKDIPIASTAQAMLTLASSLEDMSPLQVDIDQDGIVDREIVPSYEREHIDETVKPRQREHSRRASYEKIASSSLETTIRDITVYINTKEEQEIYPEVQSTSTMRAYLSPIETKKMLIQTASVWVSFEYIKNWLVSSMQKLLHILY